MVALEEGGKMEGRGGGGLCYKCVGGISTDESVLERRERESRAAGAERVRRVVQEVGEGL